MLLGSAEALKRSNPVASSLAVCFGPAAGAAGHGGQFDLADAAARDVQSVATGGFEKWAVRFVENHPQPDHASAKVVRERGSVRLFFARQIHAG